MIYISICIKQPFTLHTALQARLFGHAFKETCPPKRWTFPRSTQ